MKTYDEFLEAAWQYAASGECYGGAVFVWKVVEAGSYIHGLLENGDAEIKGMDGDVFDGYIAPTIHGYYDEYVTELEEHC